MTDSKVNFLARHEIGLKEIVIMERWRDRLKAIVRPGGDTNKRLGISDTRHFEVELKRVEKWLRNIT